MKTTTLQTHDTPMGKASIALFSLMGIIAYLCLTYVFPVYQPYANIPLYAVLGLGGIPLLIDLVRQLWHRDWGADLLAGLSIVTAVWLDEYLAGTLVVLMLSGGEAIEDFSIRKASRVLQALASRAPNIAHRQETQGLKDITVDEIKLGDTLTIYPHEICPVDGEIVSGDGSMDEAFLTGEPFQISKTIGSPVISGAINGDSAVTIRATALSIDSRYAKIMKVMQESEQRRPHLRKLADQLGAWFTPIALIIAIAAWTFTGDPVRFLAVLVIATPCPLLIAIPVVIIASISLCASRGIIIKNSAVLEQLTQCSTVIFDKTGTLTYGKPLLTDIIRYGTWETPQILRFAASLESYSKHPLASAILNKAKKEGLDLLHPHDIQEVKGQYLRGNVDGHDIVITSRKQLTQFHLEAKINQLPAGIGLECLLLVDGQLAAYLRFHDAPRADSLPFIQHLNPKHGVNRIMILSGDRAEEVNYFAQSMGIDLVHANQSPEDKLALVTEEVRQAQTAFLGDGINDAPALMAATVGIAFGRNSDVTAEAADAVIMNDSLQTVDEFFHISRRMRSIALQSALGGMLLSFIGMLFAATGHLTPVAGAITQEIIDVAAILNALRMIAKPKHLSDI